MLKLCAGFAEDRPVARASTADLSLLHLLSELGEQDVDRRGISRQNGDPQLSAQTPASSAQVRALLHP